LLRFARNDGLAFHIHYRGNSADFNGVRGDDPRTIFPIGAAA
jgi:hypothetical protein